MHCTRPFLFLLLRLRLFIHYVLSVVVFTSPAYVSFCVRPTITKLMYYFRTMYSSMGRAKKNFVVVGNSILLRSNQRTVEYGII